MNIIEQFTCGKKDDPALNEDRIVVTEHFVAVIDGVTAKACPPIDGKSGGRFAAEAGEAILHGLDPGIDAQEAVSALSNGLRERTRALSAGIDKPAFGIIVYSVARREVWRVADLGLMIDGIAHKTDLPLDRVASGARSAVIAAALAGGATVEDLRRDDPGRTFIAPMLGDQHRFANREGPYGYGVINGTRVPDAFIAVFNAARAQEIVMASDGYPKLFMTLQQSEAYLADLLREDPLLYLKHPSTKGLMAGQVSFDDRAYIRFSL